MEIEKRSTRSQSRENSLWNWLWAYRKTDYRMSEFRAWSLTKHINIFDDNIFFYRIFTYLFM